LGLESATNVAQSIPFVGEPRRRPPPEHVRRLAPRGVGTDIDAALLPPISTVHTTRTGEVRMGRILAFTRPHNATTAQARYPRFTEVTAYITRLADELFAAPTSLEAGIQIYRDLQGRLAPVDRERLATIYDAIVAHEEKFEQAAYIVGLLAGSGQLLEIGPFLNEREVGSAES
jgi:hypothetical protein